MDSVKAILKEELGRLSSLKRNYRSRLSSLPKGSIQQKKIKGIWYPYLVSWKNHKIVYKYLGRLSPDQLKELESKIELRKRYESQSREVKKNESKLKQVIYDKRRAV